MSELPYDSYSAVRRERISPGFINSERDRYQYKIMPRKGKESNNRNNESESDSKRTVINGLSGNSTIRCLSENKYDVFIRFGFYIVGLLLAITFVMEFQTQQGEELPLLMQLAGIGVAVLFMAIDFKQEFRHCFE